MKLRAAAFAGRENAQRIKELFGAEEVEVFGGKTVAQCSQCLAEFQLIFRQVDDEDNPRYFADIEKQIAEDCDAGKHKAEYLLKTQP